MTNDEDAPVQEMPAKERKSFLRKLFSQAEPAPSKRPAVDPAWHPQAEAVEALRHSKGSPTDAVEAAPEAVVEDRREPDVAEPIPADPARAEPARAEPAALVPIEAPPLLADVIWLRPGISPNCRSSGAVTDDVITSGLAPG